MALVTDRKAPKDVPVTSNTLDGITDPDARPPAEIRAFGKTLITVADPPEPGDTVVILMRLRVYDVGTEFNENGEGEGTPYRKTKLVSCWKAGTTEPEPKKSKAQKEAEEQKAAEEAAAENQPPLFDEDAEPEAIGDLVDDVLGDVGRPDFSDGSDQ